MINSRHNRGLIWSLLILALAVAAIVIVASGARGGRDVSETRAIRAAAPDASPVLVRAGGPAGIGAADRDTTVFAIAAASNARLRSELEWTFGGKPQRGWYIYEPLLGAMLGVTDGAASPAFAAAVARWQKSADLPPTGIIDDTTFYTIIAQWQSVRLKDHTVARSEQMITAPPADFFDPTRNDELRRVESRTYAAYKRMVAAALSDRSLGLRGGTKGELAPDEHYLKIISSFRSPEYQEQLRKQSPGAGRAGLALVSTHFTGRALDIYVGGDAVSTADSNRALQTGGRVYQWLVRNAGRFGFRPYFYEPWHWEYVG